MHVILALEVCCELHGRLENFWLSGTPTFYCIPAKSIS